MQNGITVEDDEALKPKPAVRDCPRCNLVNTFENKYCSKCRLSSGTRCVRRNKGSREFKIAIIGRKTPIGDEQFGGKDGTAIQPSHIYDKTEPGPSAR